MSKYKICVYAICKNEEKFVDRFMDSVASADGVYILDTGSTDNTVQKLKQRGATVQTETIDPWRFDIARNRSLQLVPEDTDICLCMDLDEVIRPGWRKELETIWSKNTNRVAYNYNWSFDEYGNPATNFFIEKIHDRKNYIWKHPVHEVLYYQGQEPEIKLYTNNITVDHFPDSAKSRGQYLTLLELSVEEDPEDDRNMHYLGREYMYYGKWNECIDTLIKHLNLKSATWKDERCASMRYIAKSYQNLNRSEEASMWYEKAIKEAPYLREPYVDYAILKHNLQDHQHCYDLLKQALSIKERGKTYINENYCWDGTIEDILSIAAYYLGKQEEASSYIKKAIQKQPNNQRLIENQKIMDQKL